MKSYNFVLLLILLGSSDVLSQKSSQLLREDSHTDNDDTDSGEDNGNGVICDGDTHFELLTGYVYTSAEDILTSREGIKFLKDCIDLCRKDTSCRAINFETGLCITFGSAAGENSDKLQISQFPVFTLYAQKICMPSGFKSCPRAWAYETSPVLGIAPEYADAETKAMGRLDCALQCLNYQEFECRTASYNMVEKTCSLSKTDRYSVGGKRVLLRVVPDEYLIENYCTGRISKSKCHFKKLPGKVLKTVDAFFNDTVEDEFECKEKCLDMEDFECKTYDFMKTDSGKFCRLSHHTEASLRNIQEPYILMDDNHNSFELVSCYQIDVECRGDGMSATIKTNGIFDGLIYSKGHISTCSKDAKGEYSTTIDLPYYDTKCSVLQEKAGLFKADIVVQNHDVVVQGQDFGLSLHCKYSLENQTVRNDLPFIELKDGVHTEYTKETIVRSPEVSMTITLPDGNEIVSAQVGDKLALLFRIETENSPYEIFVRNVVATGSNEEESITLIDDRGCPIQPSIMKSVVKVDSTKDLKIDFSAFKFPDNDQVQFNALVSPCLPRCQKVVCDSDAIDGMTTYSLGRKKRAISEDAPLLLARSVKITDKFEFEDSLSQQIVEKEETTLYKACISTYALIIAIVIFIIAEVVLLVIWRNLWHKRQSNKHIEPISAGIPPEMIFGSLSSRSSSTRYLTS